MKWLRAQGKKSIVGAGLCACPWKMIGAEMLGNHRGLPLQIYYNPRKYAFEKRLFDNLKSVLKKG